MTRRRSKKATYELSGTSTARAARQQHVRGLARGQAGVVHRRQLYDSGITRWQIRAEVDAGRWLPLGDQTVLVEPGAPQREVDWWRAVLQVGPTAALAGVSSLQSYGLRGVDSEMAHVATPKSARPMRTRGVHLHETRRFREEDVDRTGLPRQRPAAAAVFAALWARSPRQAALFLVAPVQQGLVRPAELQDVLDRVRRHPYRTLLRHVLADLGDGAQSLGELDFARLCRARGLPAPTRQRVVRLTNGRLYLDVAWDDFNLVVEIDGIQHLEVASYEPDSLRQNEVSLGGRRVLRIPVLSLRVDPTPFLEQVERALLAGGWSGRTTDAALRPTRSAQ